MTGTSTSPANSCKANPIPLPQIARGITADQSVFSDDAAPACSPKAFADIAYVTGQRKFWLLPERLQTLLIECSNELSASAVLKDRDARNQALAQHGLHEPFIPIDAYVFLSPEDQQHYDAIEEEIRSLKEQIAADEPRVLQRYDAAEQKVLSQRGINAQKPYLAELRDARAELHSALRDRRERLRKLHLKRGKLRSKGYSIAKGVGFHIENEKMYGLREVQVREALQAYNSFMAKVRGIDFTEYNRLTNEYQPVWDVLNAYRKVIESCQSGALDCQALEDFRARYDYLVEYRLGGYIEPIIALANLGIATPEFALCSNSDMASGLKEYKDYLEAYKKKQEAINDAEERFDRFVKATGGYSPPPSELLSKQRAKIAELQPILDRLRQQADANMQRMRPTRQLLWDTHSYEMRHQDSVCNDDIPLREFSLASITRPLAHLSLYDLANKSDPELAATLKKDHARTARFASLYRADPDAIFSAFLERQGAIPLEEQDPRWFDKNGLFIADDFFNYLQESGWQVKSLESQAATWGKKLLQMIFEDSTRQQLRLFDTSYQAQFVRLLGMDASEVNVNAIVRTASPQVIPAAELDALTTRTEWMETSSSVEASGIDDSPKILKERTLASAALGMTVDIGRGEVDLVNIEIPKKAEASAITLRFNTPEGTEASQPIGHFYLSYSVVAWGFAGVSLMLAREVVLEVDNNGRPSISGVDFGQREGQAASIKLFAGAQVGCTIKGGLHWKPPLDALILSPNLDDKKEASWQTLSAFMAEGSLGVGIGREFDFRVGLIGGKLMFSIKASVFFGPGAKGAYSFELDYQGIKQLLMLYRRVLMRNNFRRIDWIDENAFNYLSKITLFGTLTLANVSEFSALLATKLDSLIDEVVGNPSKRAGQIAYTLVNEINREAVGQWFLGMPPETLGPLLYTLSSEPRGFNIQSDGQTEPDTYSTQQASDFQQIAIARCLEWTAGNASGKRFSELDPNPAQVLFQKALERMSIDASHSDDKLVEAKENLSALEEFMRNPGKSLEALTSQANFKQLKTALTLHLKTSFDILKTNRDRNAP
ncbi:conserved hypothetical protein [Pseudomonas sp. 8BK]|uniref:hypothetical protein n=1 Tax=Pseudomonas sp. 8BK TaxID=2653164 RepID=UPI0012F10A24|nr:hypothetical protein [Pseudomonas sp. 8BK]VXB37506.1 conserved hypothetical protein [Pseudomonas sp. 8BK]